MRIKPLVVLSVIGPLWLGPPARAAEPNLAPVIERLRAPSARERLTALRDLTRLRPEASVARPALDKLLADPSPEVRTELTWSIRELLGPRGADLLQRLSAHPEPMVRGGVIRAACRMWDHREPRDVCRSLFSDPDPVARIEVIGVLRDAFPKDPEAVALFREGLRDPVEAVQRAAVFGVLAARDPESVAELGRIARTASDLAAEPAAGDALATIGTPAAVEQILSLTVRPKSEPGRPPRPSDRVRAAAVRALERVRAPAAAPRLRELLTDPSPLVRASAISALAALRDRAAAPAIGARLQDPDPNVRQFALRALRTIGDSCCAQEIRRVFREDRLILVRASAASTLADLLGPESIPDLAAAVNDPAPLVRAEAVATLGGLGRPAAGALVNFLADPDPDVRRQAVIGLSQVGGREAIPAMRRAAETSRADFPQLRVTIAEALGVMRQAEGVPTLTVLAADRTPQVRRAAAVALGRIGGREAEQTLRVLLADPAPAVRTAAEQAIQNRSAGR